MDQGRRWRAEVGKGDRMGKGRRDGPDLTWEGGISTGRVERWRWRKGSLGAGTAEYD